MPIYKMSGKKDGKQKYRVRINYIDKFGNKKQIDRVAYGSEEAKSLERILFEEIKKSAPTVTERDYTNGISPCRCYAPLVEMTRGKEERRCHFLLSYRPRT